MRARRWHAIETLLDNILGYVINFFLIFVIYNWVFGHSIEVSQNLAGGVIFFFVAWARKYTLRRIFSSIIKKQYGLD